MSFEACSSLLGRLEKEEPLQEFLVSDTKALHSLAQWLVEIIQADQTNGKMQAHAEEPLSHIFVNISAQCEKSYGCPNPLCDRTQRVARKNMLHDVLILIGASWAWASRMPSATNLVLLVCMYNIILYPFIFTALS